MQDENGKSLQFKQAVGRVIHKLRCKNSKKSLNKFALEYDINRANLSKIENGQVGCSLSMAWKIAEALGMKLSVFIKQIEEELGEDFTFIDE